MKTLALLAALALTGCASWQQAINGYEAAGLTTIQSANDNAIHVWTAAACGTPLSAVIRNPQVIPALQALCLPAGAAASPTAMLEAAKR